MTRAGVDTSCTQGLYEVDGGWSLAPEGGVIHAGERVAVVADVHLGYEWRRARGGDCVGVGTLDETTSRLATMLARSRVAVERLIVAGDLVESSRACARTSADVEALSGWLAERGVALVAVRGNHDPVGRRLPERVEVGDWTVAHGDRPIVAARLIQGHLHPAVAAGGTSFPCFLAGASRIVLPSFSRDAAGWNVATRLAPGPRGPRDLACIAAADDAWVVLGRLRLHNSRNALS